MFGEGTLVVGVLTGSGSGRIVGDSLEWFAQFARNGKLSSSLDPKQIHKRPAAGKGCTMLRTSSRAGGHAADPFSRQVHRR
jgi:hypothetical protein